MSRGAHLFTWTNMGNADDGDPIGPNKGSVAFSDKTVQVIGSFHTGTLVIEGSNDGSNWITLTDPSGNALSFTVEGLQTILQNPAYIRPRVTSGSPDLTVIVSARAIIQLR